MMFNFPFQDNNNFYTQEQLDELGESVYEDSHWLTDEYENPDCTGVTDTCPDMECSSCAIRECPHGEPLHFHHDGCPACYLDQDEIDKKKEIE